MKDRTIDVGVAGLTLAGQSISGDRHIVEPFSGGVLLAVIDGIGHGSEAALAAETACGILVANAAEPVINLAERCHDGLRSTRGVVMSLAAIDEVHSLVTWLGIGNVQGVLLRSGPEMPGSEESLLLRPGVVGSHLPPLRASVVPFARGDILMLATDGVRSGFSSAIASGKSSQSVAESILEEHGKGTDDSLVLVARYLGCTGDGNRKHDE